MEQYDVTGMSCAACSARVEKAVSAVDGVTSCSVNLLMNTMGVEGTADPSSIIAAVEAAGYGASLKGAKAAQKPDDEIKDKETPKIIKRLAASVIFLAVLMYFSMGHMVGLPLPEALEHSPAANGLIQLLLAALVMVINQKFFISGFKGLINRAPNMDTLVALGSSAAFGYSVYALFAAINAQTVGDMQAAMSYRHEYYFESAAMILTLITVGKLLEARSKGKTTNALKGLMELAPKTAKLIRDGKEVSVPVEQVKAGDIFVVRPGESVPVDGTVIDGSAAVDESALTGESLPSDKREGSSVSAGTVNLSGFMKCEASRVGEATTLSQIIKMVENAAATKAPIAKIADKVSAVFVPTVMTIALVTVIAWLIAGESFGFALARGISVLVISCPCALGLATPVAITVGSGVGAKNGILFKTAVSLEETGKAKTVVLDKTGTVTSGKPVVTDIMPCGISENRLLEYAYSLEARSEHPLAGAVNNYSHNAGIKPLAVDEFKALPGNGLCAVLDGEMLVGGNEAFVSEYAVIGDEQKRTANILAENGKTPLFFALGSELLGIIAVADTLKEDSREAIDRLHKMGLRVIMLTGDNKRTAKAVGKAAGVDEVIAEVLPDGKERVVCELGEKGKTVMVGDGINDAPALTRADTGIAIGAGTDIAIDAADVVLVNSRLSDVPAAIKLSRATLRNIKENLFWAFIYNIIGIPVAAGVFIPIFGWQLSPMLGAAAMSLSSFCVVTNALRLNFFKTSNETVNNNFKEENKAMKKTLYVEGMMCAHCEARVKSVLEELPEVTLAEVSHESGTAKVTFNADISDEALKAVIEAQGYKVK